MAPHSSTLAWKIPWTEEPGRLQSKGSLRVRQGWVTSLSLFTFMRRRRKWQPTSVFLPGESQGWGSLVGCRLWGHTESDTAEVTYEQQQQQHLGGEQQSKGTLANCCATWLAVSGFMVMGLVLGVWLANHWLKVLPDGTGIAQPRWIQGRILGGGSDIWTGYSSLLLTSPEFFQLVVACWFWIPYQYFLLYDNSCKWLLWCLARAGGFGQWFPYYFFCCSLLKWF